MLARLAHAAIFANAPLPMKRGVEHAPWLIAVLASLGSVFPVLMHVCSFTLYERISRTLLWQS